MAMNDSNYIRSYTPAATGMELVPYYALSLFTSLLIIAFLTLKIRNSNPRRREQSRAIPGPRNLPIIGSLHRIAGRRPPHQSFRDLSAVYGPVMHLKLGDIHVVVISSAEAAREILKTHDLDFASRPVSATVSAVSYGANDILFGPYGEFWRQMRRLCTMELLSTKRVRGFRAIREDEASNLIRLMAASSEVAVDLGRKMAEASHNIIVRAAVGGRSDDQKDFFSALSDTVEFLSGFTIVDLFPSMPFISRITGFGERLERCQKKMDLMAARIVEAHREKRAKRISNHDDEQLIVEEDLTDVLLRVQREDSLQFPLSDDNIKAVINDMLFAGSETTSTTLEWAMSEMVRNPTVMEKAQSEVREVINGDGGTGKLVDEELISGRLPYLQLVIKETLRLHPPAPLLLPRVSQESKEILGYAIPAKTKVMVNMWAMGREERYWGDPENFRPERFEGGSVDFKGAHFEYAPFGAGRRICPGMQFAVSALELILAHLLYYFDWKFEGGKGEKLDMGEAAGVTTRRKFPLCLVPTLRFPVDSTRRA